MSTRKLRYNNKFNAKPRHDKQIIPDDLMHFENVEILKCFEHFNLRFKERWLNDINLKGLTINGYWLDWVLYLRGEFSHFSEKGKMIRFIGHYIKDPVMYKIVYTKINIEHNDRNDEKNVEIYIPLTLYKIEDQSGKLHAYKRILLNKKRNGI
jgi:hypothetical protein